MGDVPQLCFFKPFREISVVSWWDLKGWQLLKIVEVHIADLVVMLQQIPGFHAVAADPLVN